MKFKVGDIVKVKENLVEGKKYGKLEFLGSDMSVACGKKFMVREISPNDNYILHKNKFYWSEEMLEHAEEEY